MLHLRRRALRALVLTIAILALGATTASAEPLVGAGADAAGDGPTSGRDLVEARVAFDREVGAISAAVTFAGPVGAGDGAQLGIIAHSGTASECRQSEGGTLFALSGSTAPASTWFAFGNVDSVFEFGVQPERSADGRTITASYADERLRGYDLRCLDVRLSADNASIDAITPFWFRGLGPDTDRDGVADNVDRCAEHGLGAPDGCPALGRLARPTSPLPPSSIRRAAASRCQVPRLAGLTVPAARKRLVKGRCRLGEVTGRPGRAGRPVVRGQEIRPGAWRKRGTRVDVVVGPRRAARG